jgi:hypothetical protein
MVAVEWAKPAPAVQQARWLRAARPTRQFSAGRDRIRLVGRAVYDHDQFRLRWVWLRRLSMEAGRKRLPL